MADQLLAWFHELQSISQYGLTYGKDVYDRERYTSIARIAAEMAAQLTRTDPLAAADALSLEVGAPTPKLDVRAAVFDGPKILLARETSDGKWSLPGGWVDIGEAPARAAERETQEETGFVCRARKLIAVWDRNRHAHPPMLMHVYKLFFLCELEGGQAATSHETSEVGFFARHELPDLSTGRVTEAQIAVAFAHRDQPDLPTEFD